jgi:hypothetical protein
MNIHQIFIANPITTNAGTDLMYFGQSPYTIGNDAAMTFSNFSTQFLSNVLTTKGDLIGYSTLPIRIAAGADGSLLQAQSSLAAGLSWTTATYPGVTGINRILYSTANNVVGQLAAATSSVLIATSSGVPGWVDLLDGEIVIGSSSGSPISNNITPGNGITITNGPGTIAIASNGATPVVNQTTASVTMVSNTFYLSNAGASLVTFTLPIVSAIGDWIEISGFGTGLWKIAQASGQQINFSITSSTLGAGGSIASVNKGDCVRLRCSVANTIWAVMSQSSTGLTVV